MAIKIDKAPFSKKELDEFIKGKVDLYQLWSETSRRTKLMELTAEWVIEKYRGAPKEPTLDSRIKELIKSVGYDQEIDIKIGLTPKGISEKLPPINEIPKNTIKENKITSLFKRIFNEMYEAEATFKGNDPFLVTGGIYDLEIKFYMNGTVSIYLPKCARKFIYQSLTAFLINWKLHELSFKVKEPQEEKEAKK